MNKVFITGISGLLGANIARELAGATILGSYNSHAVDFKQSNVSTVQLDLNDAAKTEQTILAFAPDTIIHCAALTNVDYCEQHPDAAHAAHVTVTENLVRIATKAGAKLVFISTDSVFDGKKGFYTEQDTPKPLNVYAQTKLQGEQAALKHPNTIVLRTNMYGWNVQDKKSLAEWVLDNLKNDKKMDGFTDILFSPVLVNRIARIIKHLCAQDYRGTLHIASTDSMTKYYFATAVAETFGYPTQLISARESAGKFAVARPERTTLATGKARQLGVPLASIRDDLREMKHLLDSGAVAELKQAKAH
jgi:dTDP-4-dehydrorhamnose reductase